MMSQYEEPPTGLCNIVMQCEEEDEGYIIGVTELITGTISYDCRSYKKSVCAEAASRGHLDILKMARESGYQWDVNTCIAAALNDHLGVLIWAIEHGCPCNDILCTMTAHNGNLEVLQWSVQHGYKLNWEHVTMLGPVPNNVVEWATSNNLC